MKKQIYIKPRQTGKSTQAVQVFKNILRKEGKGLFVSYNKGTTNNIEKLLGSDYDRHRMRTTTYDNLNENIFIGNEFKIIVLDDFLNIRSRKQIDIYSLLSRYNLRIENLYMCSTPNVQVQKDMIEYITKNKGNVNYNDMLNYCKSNFWIDENTFTYWFKNFITDNDSNLIVDNFYASSTKPEELKAMLGTEAFELQIKNKLFT